MKEVVRQEILYNLSKLAEFLSSASQDLNVLKVLSDHAIEDVAVHKDLDVISITVLIYSISKILPSLKNNASAQSMGLKVSMAVKALNRKNFSAYNRYVKEMFEIIRSQSDKIKEHLQDVMQAARIKKGTALLEKGLSMGQAAGLMGLSNWDLQVYAAKTTAVDGQASTLAATKRMRKALLIFGV